MFEKKFDHIFEDVEFPSKVSASDIMHSRQDSVQHLWQNNKFIYDKDESGKYINPFTSNYIKRSLFFLFFGKKPRFPNLSAGIINHHVIAVVCTFVSFFLLTFDIFYKNSSANSYLIISFYSSNT